MTQCIHGILTQTCWMCRAPVVIERPVKIKVKVIKAPKGLRYSKGTLPQPPKAPRAPKVPRRESIEPKRTRGKDKHPRKPGSGRPLGSKDKKPRSKEGYFRRWTQKDC